MKKKFTASDFDEVIFINSGRETQEVLEAKEYLKNIQMSMNIADVNDSLFYFEDYSKITNKKEKEFFKSLEESIFSTHSLAFLQKTKLLTSFEGFNLNLLEDASFKADDNYIFLNSNLKNQCCEFITSIWDCILLIKISDKKAETSVLIEPLNKLFIKLTILNGGKEDDFIKKENNLDMICELSLFLQFYLPDFFIYLVKSDVDISCKNSCKKANKEFISVFKKSKKILHRLQMLEQIKSNNYQYLLSLLIKQLNSELK